MHEGPFSLKQGLLVCRIFSFDSMMIENCGSSKSWFENDAVVLFSSDLKVTKKYASIRMMRYWFHRGARSSFFNLHISHIFKQLRDCRSMSPTKGESWSYLIADGKLHRETEKLQILLESPSSLPNLRLARYVNIADLVRMHKPLL